MKKGLKIVLITIISLIILLIGFIFLIIKGILPNPFLDTKDLVCKLENIPEYNGADVLLTFNFDKNTVFKGYSEEYIYKYETEEIATEIYEKLRQNSNSEISIDGKTVKLSNYYKSEKDKGYYGKTKKQIKKIYVSELLYECK